MRSYVQRCNGPPVRNLMTFGSPHGGVAAFPGCERSDDKTSCKLALFLISRGVYLDWIQHRVVQAQYFKVAPFIPVLYRID